MYSNQTTILVTAQEMRLIEEEIFSAGMPVASLMEKVALKTAQKIKDLYPLKEKKLSVGFIIGSGHNGGDALVVARELYCHGYDVIIYAPLIEKFKELTAHHFKYASSLGITIVSNIEALNTCHIIIDGLFGFGLTRKIIDNLAENINTVNGWHKPVISIDIPSGINSDTGAVLGVAIKAKNTLCLGLYKKGIWQDKALEYLGQVERIDFDIPSSYVDKITSESPSPELLTAQKVKDIIPLPRQVTTYKYKQGHLLLICGSKEYAGAALLSAYGARSSGVGMVTMVVPESLTSFINAQLPEMLVIGCRETPLGSIETLPLLDWDKYQWVSCGMGLTKEAVSVVEKVISSNCNILLDADALNVVANYYLLEVLQTRQGKTVLTPHDGEFERLFPDFSFVGMADRIEETRQGAIALNATILRKGAKTVISDNSHTWIIPHGTPALARGGSGDVLSGFIGGLLAQNSFTDTPVIDTVAAAGWLHQQGAILASEDLSVLGVDGVTLSRYILKAVNQLIIDN
ncbi:bifunctional ADP-dependent NAD(P)H-hydrate dehydratase/NAD(P)H-hydrate epimerase [Cyanobacterium sp. IPPAS B-1200]|uniref:bifunctional ADP-dependent NAD(P)H-hydrate dehydratase/NAD(P)H-hydrate epimerase n=1 Tax=Cyanobacterium sp. IPPAS B-1200 TaxID=1562720 RepID=UPI00085258EF|nr:bifunctional ADP-dependent NAD(P)H-hydrate dehydratase/NAD(P)H-hydrate epimerase [Cyanobacterium sp. IPPAS B-1200]OEJ77479.1 bifunctional ADP-dependent (S)-NAD(P)H-hydrate dehydratase/NAD(P)H-hydrate epimerase [Cyanobacterium sp. IPPAS B-1200]